MVNSSSSLTKMFWFKDFIFQLVLVSDKDVLV